MHNHLALVKTIHCTPKFEREVPHLSEMDIIFYQALLMDAGSITFKAIKAGEISAILAGLVGLAYTALQALAMQDKDIETTDEHHQDYQMLAIMRLLSEKIHHCSSGKAKDYSELYHLCASLTSGFINADFDKAFRVYHDWYKAYQDANPGADIRPDLHKTQCPDLTDCLFE